MKTKLPLFLASLLVLMVAACHSSQNANSSTEKPKAGIHFLQNTTYEEILKIAQQQGKPVLIDFYTTWCAPCKWIEEDVFSLESVSDYYNNALVNYKVNAEKFEGIELAQQFKVEGYPTLVFVAQNGEVIHTHLGMIGATKFLQLGEEAVRENKATRMNN